MYNYYSIPMQGDHVRNIALLEVIILKAVLLIIDCEIVYKDDMIIIIFIIPTSFGHPELLL